MRTTDTAAAIKRLGAWLTANVRETTLTDGSKVFDVELDLESGHRVILCAETEEHAWQLRDALMDCTSVYVEQEDTRRMGR